MIIFIIILVAGIYLIILGGLEYYDCKGLAYRSNIINRFHLTGSGFPFTVKPDL